MNHWFVVHTKPRKEHVALENLHRQGFTAYCPQTIQTKRKRQQWQKVSEPLFPRYVFVQLNMGKDNISPIRSTTGVIGLVQFGNKPASLPQHVIEAIQQKEQEIINTCVNQPQWQRGDLLEVLDGPFGGLIGIYQQKESAERVSLLLDILGRQTQLTLSVNCLASVI
jgi:transcriptional antiterminator RfaH